MTRRIGGKVPAAASCAAFCAVLGACGGHAATGPKPPVLPGDEAPAAAPVVPGELHGALVLVDVVGLPGDREQTARSALHSAVGAGFDRAQVAADLRALWALGSVADARASARAVRGGVALRYSVREQPRIHSLDVEGGRAVPAAQWTAQIPIKSGDYFDPVKLSTLRRQMLGKLQELGFFSAKVTFKSSEAKEGGVDVVFTTEEGRLVALMAVEFRGSKKVPRKTLLQLLGQNDGAAIGSRYWRGALERGLLQVSAHYHDLGYVGVAVGQVQEKVSADGGQVSIVVPIREGDQFRLGELAVEGALVAPESEYVGRFALRPGQIFSRSKVAAGIDQIRELHRSKGQPDLDVVPLTEVDAKKKTIKVTLRVVKPQAQPQPQPKQSSSTATPPQTPGK